MGGIWFNEAFLSDNAIYVKTQFELLQSVARMPFSVSRKHTQLNRRQEHSCLGHRRRFGRHQT